MLSASWHDVRIEGIGICCKSVELSVRWKIQTTSGEPTALEIVFVDLMGESIERESRVITKCMKTQS